GTAAVSLRFDANYQSFAAKDSLEIDLSSDGGATWVTLRRWGEDHGAFRSLPGETAEIDLSAYAGLANRGGPQSSDSFQSQLRWDPGS
ncbi:MAG: hypothetical protein WBG96_10960, partial [Thermoanaerobaculia bacterium]